MGLLISLLSLPKIYEKLLDFHNSINGNWFQYFQLLYKFWSNRSNCRFDLYDVNKYDNPYALGVLPPKQEWLYECPQWNKSENIVIYGSNTWGQLVLIAIKWRPQTTVNHNRPSAHIQLIIKDDNDIYYELNEQQSLASVVGGSDGYKSQTASAAVYRIAGLTIEVLEPFRKLRIKYRGYLRRKCSTEEVDEQSPLVYTKLTLFWSSLTNVYDFVGCYDTGYLAKQLSGSGVRQPMDNTNIDEFRHEQCGHMTGSVQFDETIASADNTRQLSLWGTKLKHYVTDDTGAGDTGADAAVVGKATRIYGLNCKGFGFHISARRYHNYCLQTGYVTLGSGLLYTTSAISGTTFNELESAGLGPNSLRFTVEVDEQNRQLVVDIDKSRDKYGDQFMVCDMTLNGHKGVCLVIRECCLENDSTGSKIPELLADDSGSRVWDLVVNIGDDSAKHVSISGGKGASLASLIQLSRTSCRPGFVVPDGVIVTTNAYNVLIDSSNVLQQEIDRLEKLAWSDSRDSLKTVCQEVSQTVASYAIPENIREELSVKLAKLFGDNYQSLRFAVRSSALTEDSEDMSTAGQMTTLLGVRGLDSIASAVMKCWASQFQYVAVEYKRGYGQPINCPMAVVVQQMVNCESAGVVFTCDPLTGDERELIITGNYGIGESVVSASAEPDTVRLRVAIDAIDNCRSIADIKSIDIGSKLKSIVLNTDDDNSIGVREIDTNNNNNINNDQCCLSDTMCKQLGTISLQVHQYYGNPRDIEWGVIGDTVYLLQSRPITNLNKWTDWEIRHEMDSGHQSEREYYSRANVGEVFPGATSHLCLSWLTTTWNANGFRDWSKIFHFPKHEFTVHYNKGGGIVNNAYFFLLKTGTFPIVGDGKNRMARMIQIGLFGHELDEEQYPDLFVDSSDRAPKRSIPLWVKVQLAIGSVKYFLTPERTLRQAIDYGRKHTDLFDGMCQLTSRDMFDAIIRSGHHSGKVSYAHGKATMCSTIFTALLLDSIKKFSNSDNNNGVSAYADFGRLVSCANGKVISAQVPKQIREIANAIDNKGQFIELSDERALEYLLNSDTGAASRLFKQFLVDYGHRGYKEFDFIVQQWADNPVTVVQSIKSMINGNQVLNPKSDESLDEVLNSFSTPLSWFRRLMLKYVSIPLCQWGVSLRERTKHEVVRTVDVYRKAWWRLAGQMVREGRLPEPVLMFHMTLNEIDQLLLHRDSAIVGRARLRRKLFPQLDSLKFDETTIGPYIRPRNDISNNGLDIPEPMDGQSVRAKGTPVSAGKVIGRCCVAMSLDEARNIEHGDILITYSTDIGWSPYFPMLSGLVTEIGGLISHGAVIAREYGLPGLVAVDGAHRLFKTGDRVVIDTEIGEIYKLQ
ncbi:prodigiosin synthesizing transferase PigC-like [Oppia nitens]|uniref:prodigiosin synthesizing transferase PigC-like n=1 Tax=Oppia nitens TaxID=1686743 RepID=UPI0023DB2241|nr:prodigiosin synthesizing transferase PigC-like [Oppia nitens]